jgi:hypothetical protein
MSDVDYLARSIKQLAAYEASKYKTSITFGTVVDIDEDGGVTIELIDGFVIGGAQLVLSMFCVERTIHIPYDESADDNEDADSHVHDEDEMLGDLTIVYTPGTPLSPPAGTLKISGGGNGMTVTPNGTLGGKVSFKHKHKIHPALPTIKLWRGLIVGDIVVLSEMGNGQYYVHERAELDDGNSNEILNPKEAGLKGNSKKF